MKDMYKTGTPNHGCAKTKAHGGMKIETPYGRDNSDVNGPASAERAGGMGGGKTDLSHSLKGTSAKQRNP